MRQIDKTVKCQSIIVRARCRCPRVFTFKTLQNHESLLKYTFFLRTT